MRWALLGAALLLSGCGNPSGFLRDSLTANQFQYRMDVTGFFVSRQVSGTAEVETVFCAIPLQEDIYKRAMIELHRQARLDENEMLVNLREDYDFTVYFGLYCKKRLTISADVAAVRIGTASGAQPPTPAKKKPKTVEPKLPPPLPDPEE